MTSIGSLNNGFDCGQKSVDFGVRTNRDSQAVQNSVLGPFNIGKSHIPNENLSGLERFVLGFMLTGGMRRPDKIGLAGDDLKSQ